jgi:hypothetical protein
VQLTKYCSGDKIEKSEMGGVCSAYGGEERSAQGFMSYDIFNCSWVITRWQWLLYMYTNMKKKIVTRKFKSGGLHERHVVATWTLGNHLSIRL